MKQLMILMLALSAMALSACDAVPFLAQPTPTKTATKVPTLTPRPTATFTPVPTATPTAVPTPANPGESLTKAFSGWRNVKSFRAQMTTTPKTGAATQMSIEVVMPDRFHMVADKFEAIMIGTTFYMKTGTTWIKTALPKGFDFSVADVKKLETELKATTTTKFIGADLLDAKPVLVYEYTTSIKGPPAVTTVSRVWVGVVDQLPLKMESTSSTGSKTVTIYSDYNSDVKIEAPIK